ncbi:metallophosphoesterase [Aeoliella mucimassa]|uniref:Putative metallophosphoesterase n=1 Tax=Aeoliella mucimassa TaxID=2527972 RepID=A0A518AHC7_9BACT|nr:metallophosphoesterase [Aeoliella mucimassa]QDU54138.1 putative metallophosphoesterase [Aeoliella mucimassa]
MIGSASQILHSRSGHTLSIITMPTEPVKVNRRRFLRRAALCTVGGAAAAGFYAWRVEPHWVDVVERTMPLRNLPAELEGAQLVQLSDIHVGEFVSYPYLQHSIDRVAASDPEVVAITGDLMTARHLEQIDPVVDLVKRLKPDQRKVIAIPGNHDYGHGAQNVKVADVLFERLTNIGVECLRNQTTTYRGLQFVGLDELWSGRFSARRALKEFDTARAGIALSHNPDSVDHNGWDGFQGWVLSGHTHGGQCRVPYFGAPIIPIKNRRYVSGEVSITPETTLYVNRGLGHSLQVRFMCSPEITRFRLTSAESAPA